MYREDFHELAWLGTLRTFLWPCLLSACVCRFLIVQICCLFVLLGALNHLLFLGSVCSALASWKLPRPSKISLFSGPLGFQNTLAHRAQNQLRHNSPCTNLWICLPVLGPGGEARSWVFPLDRAEPC